MDIITALIIRIKIVPADGLIPVHINNININANVPIKRQQTIPLIRASFQFALIALK